MARFSNITQSSRFDRDNRFEEIIENSEFARLLRKSGFNRFIYGS
jgi:hypothetical protein